MKIQSETLIAALTETITQHINFATALKERTDIQLNRKESQHSWSILECLEHLNLYGDFYIPEIEKVIRNSKSKNELIFKSGILGNFFAESMLPKEKLNKMKTLKDKNPLNSSLERNTIDRFIHQQNQILALLDKARTISLNKEKTAISITSLINLRLGDTFRFIINHNIRHLKQIEKVINQL